MLGCSANGGWSQGICQWSLWLTRFTAQLLLITYMQTQGERFPSWDMQMDRGAFLSGRNKRIIGKESKVLSKFSGDFLILPYWRRRKTKKLLQKLARSCGKFRNTFPPSPLRIIPKKRSYRFGKETLTQGCCGLNCVLHKFRCLSPNPWYFRTCFYLEVRS